MIAFLKVQNTNELFQGIDNKVSVGWWGEERDGVGQLLLYKRTICNRETIILDHPHLVGEVDCQSFVKASFQRFQRMAEFSISSVECHQGT